MLKRIEVKIKGRVQGVFFRYTTDKIAKKLGLKGFVMNTSDGTVFTIAEGPEEQLLEFIKFLKKGPKHARVDNIEVQWLDQSGEFKDFFIKGW
ncbi:MAG: acylphosphatase [Candidatus Lokiarchaeota archaeon]|nr:acylphosphatase [Candidatus Lokiarchaeota archaeon]